MNSNVGNPQVYEAGDQRTKKTSELGANTERYHEGKENSHNLTDSSKSDYLPWVDLLTTSVSQYLPTSSLPQSPTTHTLY